MGFTSHQFTVDLGIREVSAPAHFPAVGETSHLCRDLVKYSWLSDLLRQVHWALFSNKSGGGSGISGHFHSHLETIHSMPEAFG